MNTNDMNTLVHTLGQLAESLDGVAEDLEAHRLAEDAQWREDLRLAEDEASQAWAHAMRARRALEGMTR